MAGRWYGQLAVNLPSAAALRARCSALGGLSLRIPLVVGILALDYAAIRLPGGTPNRASTSCTSRGGVLVGRMAT
jgi:hypothetical protein